MQVVDDFSLQNLSSQLFFFKMPSSKEKKENSKGHGDVRTRIGCGRRNNSGIFSAARLYLYWQHCSLFFCFCFFFEIIILEGISKKILFAPRPIGVKADILEKRAQHYLKNKKDILQKRARHYVQNQDDKRQKSKQQYALNKESAKATRRRYNAVNKEKIAAVKKRWYAANREDCLDKGYWAFKDNQESKQKQQRERYLANKDKINEKRRDSYNKNEAYRTVRNAKRCKLTGTSCCRQSSIRIGLEISPAV